MINKIYIYSTQGYLKIFHLNIYKCSKVENSAKIAVFGCTFFKPVRQVCVEFLHFPTLQHTYQILRPLFLLGVSISWICAADLPLVSGVRNEATRPAKQPPLNAHMTQ